MQDLPGNSDVQPGVQPHVEALYICHAGILHESWTNSCRPTARLLFSVDHTLKELVLVRQWHLQHLHHLQWYVCNGTDRYGYNGAVNESAFVASAGGPAKAHLGTGTSAQLGPDGLPGQGAPLYVLGPGQGT
jgi:hypothetical protein